MSEELQQPPVIDIDGILQPISDESPSGESLRYSGLYDEIAEARRADKVADQGEWQTEIKAADHRKVIDLAVPALTSRSKDLQIAAWLAEALSWQYGFAGLRDSLKLMAGLQENFWESLHPVIDEGDMEGRANAISWMDEQAAFALKKAPVTSGGFGLIDFEDSKKFTFPDNLDSLPEEESARFLDLKAQAERENRCTADQWRKSKAATRRAFVEAVNFAVSECRAAYRALNSVIEEKFDRNQMPGTPNLGKALDGIELLVKKLLEEKRAEEPDPSDLDAAEGDGSGENAGGSGGFSASGAIQGRQEALRRLAEIAAFFQRTEPHSPVSYLVQRAVSWGNMPLESWLQDVIKDESVLHQLRQTLGLETGSGDYYQSSSGYDTDSQADDSSASSSDSW